jgi:uncharacterized membrane protein HdeD (DUF308 family)
MNTLAINWWALALRGVAGILFGILAFVLPGAAITALAIVFGAYAFVDGVFTLVHAVRGGRNQPRWGAMIFEGILGVAVGVLTFLLPVVTVLWLVLVVALWAVITGVLKIMTAIRLRKEITNEWLLGFTGAASILFGVALWWAPIAGAIVLAWWIGAYAFIAGILMIAVAFKLRRWAQREALTAERLRAA